VQSDAVTYTSGGVSAGVDLALHIVAEYLGAPVAQRTADYMQHQGTGWK
jgi:transcriptional regulator GlxA family with amidase domain